MKVVKDSSCRQVTFSKRRSGLFKKANELATLCGSEVGVVVFSPGGKPFSFGQPNVESIANRFLNQESNATTTTSSSSKKKNNNNSNATAIAQKLNQQLNNLVKQLHEEKQRGDSLEKEVIEEKGLFFGCNHDESIDRVDKIELEKMKEALEELKERVKEQAREMEALSSLLMLSNVIEPPTN